MARANCRFCGHYQEIIDDVVMGECLRCRDQFAMAAPHHEIDICLLAAGEQNEIDAVCRARYEWADAMMEARKTQRPTAARPRPRKRRKLVSKWES